MSLRAESKSRVAIGRHRRGSLFRSPFHFFFSLFSPISFTLESKMLWCVFVISDPFKFNLRLATYGLVASLDLSPHPLFRKLLRSYSLSCEPKFCQLLNLFFSVKLFGKNGDLVRIVIGCNAFRAPSQNSLEIRSQTFENEKKLSRVEEALFCLSVMKIALHNKSFELSNALLVGEKKSITKFKSENGQHKKILPMILMSGLRYLRFCGWQRAQEVRGPIF